MSRSSRPTRVGLLFGGPSVEHEVSVVSARSVDLALGSSTLIGVPIGVDHSGRWWSPELSAGLLRGGAKRVAVAPADDDGVRLVLEPGSGDVTRIASDGTRSALGLDIVFPLIHGRGGEDGRLQGALETSGLACVGAGVLGSAVGMDKSTTKWLCRAKGLAVAPWVELTTAMDDAARRAILERVPQDPGFPVFVKPSNGGSSVGISKVVSAGELQAAVELAFEHDATVIIERGIDAREIECAVLGNDDPRASVLGEIVPRGGFYDYESKYLDDSAELKVPAELEPGTSDTIRRRAIEVYRALGLFGFARVDFLVGRRDSELFLNEVNTLPGFTPISMFPKLWEATGLAYPALLEELVRLGLERRSRERTLKVER